MFVLGMDIGKKDIQVSCYIEDGAEITQPKTLALSNAFQKTNIPCAICKKYGEDIWYYGADAIEKGMTGHGFLVENLFEKLLLGEEVEIEQKSYKMSFLCNRFLGKVLKAAVSKTGKDGIKPDKIAVVIFETDKNLHAYKEELFEGMGLEEGCISIHTRRESIFSYITHQNENTVGNETAVLDFSQEEMQAYYVRVNPNTKPVVVQIEKETAIDIERKIVMGSVQEDLNELRFLDMKLCDFLMEFMRNRRFSAFFLMGNGFSGNWFEKSLGMMSRNARVFAGNNLYSCGACYLAAEKMRAKQESAYFFLGENMLSENIGMMISQKGSNYYEPLLDAGTNFYDAKITFSCMVSGCEEIVFKRSDALTGKSMQHSVSLKPFDVDSRELFEITVNMWMDNPHTVSIEITDQGLGDMILPEKEKIHSSFGLME